MLRSILWVLLFTVSCIEGTNTTSPQVRGRRATVLFTLDAKGEFRRSPPLRKPPARDTVTYTVLNSGVLVPRPGEYSVKYIVDDQGNLLPDPSNHCVYTSDRPATYLKGFRNVLIPVDLRNGTMRVSSRGLQELKPVTREVATLRPDRSCDGDVVRFLLGHTGVLQRLPEDPYLPIGTRMSYCLSEDFILRPKFGPDPSRPTLTYTLGENGDLIPSEHGTSLRAQEGERATFMLGEAGKIFPVKEVVREGVVRFYSNGAVVHRSRLEEGTVGNASVVLLNNERVRLLSDDRSLATIGGGPRFVCRGHSVQKRNAGHARYGPPVQQYPPPDLHKHYAPPLPPPAPCTTITICDDRGERIPILPELTSSGDVVLYKLTCCGHLVRCPPCREPDHGFDITFQLLLDTFTLVPCRQGRGDMLLTYNLKKNGDLIPVANETHTIKKAPGSLIVYMLGKNNVLFVVEQTIEADGSVTYYFDNQVVARTPREMNDPPKFYSTKGDPIFATIDDRTMFTWLSKRTVSPSEGSTWTNPKIRKADEKFCKSLYLVGPSDERISVVPCKSRKGVPVVYDLDSCGVFHKSPKDCKKWISLRSYCRVSQGILLPANGTDPYVFIVAKNGDLMPYIYPDNSQLKAPPSRSLKFVRCHGGILLPIKVKIINNNICYIFDDVVVYKKRSFCSNKHTCCAACIRDFDENEVAGSSESCSEEEWKKKKPKSCESCEEKKCKSKSKYDRRKYTSRESKECELPFKPFIDKNGKRVYFENCGRLLVRHPSDDVGYLKYTMGSFRIEDDSLRPVQYQNPDKKCLNLMLEPGGHLMPSTSNVAKIPCDYFVLAEDGRLWGASAVIRDSTITFYRDGVRLFRIRTSEKGKPPLGKDPMKLMEDPEPKRDKSDKPICIPIPLHDLELAASCECQVCEDLLDDWKELMCKEGAEKLAVELQLTDEDVKKLTKWAEKRQQRCRGALRKRDVLEFIKELKSLKPEESS